MPIFKNPFTSLGYFSGGLQGRHEFESVVILDSGKNEALDCGLYFHIKYAIRNTLAPDVPESYDLNDVQHLTQSLYEHAYRYY